MTDRELGLAGRIAQAWLASPLTPLVIVASLLLGGFAVWRLPREEEPQIIVPMIDVFVGMPGAGAAEVEERVTKPMEKLLWEIPGVEYVYSQSQPGGALSIVRFSVGEDEERSIVKLNQKLLANLDRVPPGATQPLVKPRSIDDVPILALTLASRRLNPADLRTLAAHLTDTIKQVPAVSAVEVIGGQRRELSVNVDPSRAEAFGVTPGEIAAAIQAANRKMPAGAFSQAGREIAVEAGELLRSRDDVSGVTLSAPGGRRVKVGDVAVVRDTAEEPSHYVSYADRSGFRDAVTLAVSKRKGANAIEVAEAVISRVKTLEGSAIPTDVEMHITRQYGETAADKSNELLLHMAIAVISVTVLVGLTLGLRESLIVFAAVPVTLALTLTVFYLYGYTLNRITLFALIVSIGILVDDAIVVVENIVRHWRMPENQGQPIATIAARAVDEVGNPTILATLTVIAAILPMAFVSGLMGPYMRPIPVGATAAMIFSLLIAFVVTPWAAVRLLRKSGHGGHGHSGEDGLTRLYRRFMGSLLEKRASRWLFLSTVTVLLVAAMGLVAIGFVKVKMLPFDNKSEFQVIVDLPEGVSLEETQRVTQLLAAAVLEQPEVTEVQTYAGLAAPFNFNGLVRHYYLRSGANVADIQVNLVGKDARKRQSHDIAKEVRERLRPLADRNAANVKVAEVPPGPPVLQTLVAEIYGPEAEQRQRIAREVRNVLESTGGVVDVDWYVEDDRPKLSVAINPDKAARAGVTEQAVARALRIASAGEVAGLLHASSAEDVPIRVQLLRSARTGEDRLGALRVNGTSGQRVALREITDATTSAQDRTLHRKNMMPVTYVTADVAGEVEAPVYAILQAAPRIEQIRTPNGKLALRTASLPEDASRYEMKWDGEWHITYEVFRDLGIAFAAVLVLIYILVVGWFKSFLTPIVIMAAIPFSLVGILPAHGLMNAFFSATSMIGFIAGAGIVVRNSIILVDFIELRLSEGMPLAEAVIDAGATRFRPMVLTAAAVVVGSAVILFDPIFQGLAIALMAGEVASLLLSRMTVPVLYFLANRDRPSRQAQPEAIPISLEA